MIARRGCPTHILSDNATNFNSKETQGYIASLGIEWHFNIPLALLHGGFSGRTVKSIKELLCKDLQRRKLNYEHFQTVLSQIEHILNNRPLTYVYRYDTE